jgi:hypothetical protein
VRRCRWELLLRARLSGCDSSSGQARRFESFYFFLLTPMLELEITEVGVSGGGERESLVSSQRASPLPRVHCRGI